MGLKPFLESSHSSRTDQGSHLSVGTEILLSFILPSPAAQIPELWKFQTSFYMELNYVFFKRQKQCFKWLLLVHVLNTWHSVHHGEQRCEH